MSGTDVCALVDAVVRCVVVRSVDVVGVGEIVGGADSVDVGSVAREDDVIPVGRGRRDSVVLIVAGVVIVAVMRLGAVIDVAADVVAGLSVCSVGIVIIIVVAVVGVVVFSNLGL